MSSFWISAWLHSRCAMAGNPLHVSEPQLPFLQSESIWGESIPKASWELKIRVNRSGCHMYVCVCESTHNIHKYMLWESSFGSLKKCLSWHQKRHCVKFFLLSSLIPHGPVRQFILFPFYRWDLVSERLVPYNHRLQVKIQSRVYVTLQSAPLLVLYANP